MSKNQITEECVGCKYCSKKGCKHPRKEYCRHCELWTPQWFEDKKKDK